MDEEECSQHADIMGRVTQGRLGLGVIKTKAPTSRLGETAGKDRCTGILGIAKDGKMRVDLGSSASNHTSYSS